jgi:uncharacterized protein YggE
MNYIKGKSWPVLMIAIVFVVMCVLSTASFAEGNSAAPEVREAARIISVTGTADIMVIPDEAVFSLAVETTNLDISKAKSENDTKIKKIKDIAKDMNIDPKYIVTDYINVNPKYTYTNSGENVFKGYTVHRGLIITLKDLKRFDELLTRLLEAGADYIQNVQFKTTQLRKYKDEARALAIKAAREKAEALAKELGQTVGKASNIQEIQENTYSYYGPWSSVGAGRATNVLSNSTSNAQIAGTQNSNYEDFSPGQIKVSAGVSVIFDLI